MVEIEMLKNEESPALGVYKKGDIRTVSTAEAKVLVSRGTAKHTKKKKEVTHHGD